MDFFDLTKRELHIKNIFLPEQRSKKKEYLSEEEAYEIVKSISQIGERYGFVGDKENKDQKKSEKRKHKYDVWIAKEIKKNLNLLDQFDKIRMILDWVIQEKVNIFSYTFEEAFEEQKKWHENIFEIYGIKSLSIDNIDTKRVIYRCSDKEHFIYLLEPEDLTYEGAAMSMCLGGSNYKANIRNNRSIIISLRDSNNKPHVTTEIGVKSKTIIQQYGKGNSNPKKEYLKMFAEFALFATEYEKQEKKDIIKLLNLSSTL